MLTKTASMRLGKTKVDPQVEELERAKSIERRLRDQLGLTILACESAENRKRNAIAARDDAMQSLEQVRIDTQEHTAFVETQHEIIVAALNEKVEKLEEKLGVLQSAVKSKDEEFQHLKEKYTDNISKRDTKIDALTNQLRIQACEVEGTMLEGFARLTEALMQDLKEKKPNFYPWSSASMDKIELEFLCQSILDESLTSSH